MEPDEYARIAAAEDDHWWYRNTRVLMADALGPWLGQRQTILDAGCGPGGNGAWLAEHGDVIGVDLAPEALDFVRDRHRALAPVRASIGALPFPEGSFDVVVGVTVVYSITDDAGAVRELARVLRPGGALMLFEPAFASLRRAHDVTVHTVRRYRRADLAELVAAAGLQVERSAYAYSFLALPALGLAIADRILPRRAETSSDVDRRRLDGLFAPLATLERRWLVRHRVPFGTSTLVVGSRPV
ncbi:MAG TPA: class I SAM-dependent methyltransferase [Acidimicrobiia bacterium]